MYKKILALVLCLCLAALPAVAASERPLEGYIIIMHTGNLYLARESGMSLDMVEEARQRFIDEGAQVLLLDTGNAFGAPGVVSGMPAETEGAEETADAPEETPPVVTEEESALLTAMKNAGYDALSLGPLDFALGVDHLFAIRDEATFPLLCVNALNRQNEHLFGGTKAVVLDGVRIGVFGMTGTVDREDAVTGDAIGMAQSKVNSLREEGCELVIMLCSMGMDEMGDPEAVALANQVEGLDIVIDVTVGAPAEGLWLENGTLVTSGGEALENIGVIAIDPAGNCAATVIDDTWM